jgi:hypothetical protein
LSKRECTFISNVFILWVILAGVTSIPHASAQEPGGPASPGMPAESPSIPTGKKEEANLFDQYSPYLDYGDFSASEEEDADTLYFQYGRFFGVSLGLGYQTATGNRGLLYEAALPRFDLKVHYWFDFQFAMAMGIWFATHNFQYEATNYTASLNGYYADLKYYFDVRDASAPITFANPHLLLGVGAISLAQTTSGSVLPTNDATLSLSFGAGFEFPISHKKTYFLLDMRYWTQNFQDTDSDDFINRVPDLTGGYFSLMGHLMFTW